MSPRSTMRPLTLALVAMTVPNGLRAQEPDVRTLVEFVRIGGTDAPEAAAWRRPPSVALGPDGNVYVRTPTQVTSFDSSGQALTMYGKEGQGPSEFMRTSSHGFFGDTLWVYDGRQSKIALFRVDGEFIMTRRMEGPEGIRWAVPNGGLVYMPNAGGGFERPRLPVTLLLRGQDNGQSLFTREYSGLFIPELATFGLEPFPSLPLMDLSGNGEWLAYVEWPDTGDDEVEIVVTLVHTRSGEESKRFVPMALKPLARSFVDSIVDEGVVLARRSAARAERLGYPVPRDVRGAVSDGLLIPRMAPPVDDVDVANDGTVWLHLWSADADNEAMVLPAGGGAPFWVSFPTDVAIQEVTDTDVWTTELGEFDVPIIRGFRVTGQGDSEE